MRRLTRSRAATSGRCGLISSRRGTHAQRLNIRWFNALAVTIVLTAGLAAYSGSLSGPFVFDDPSSITDNPTIRHLWPPWEALATPKANVTTQGRPLLNLSFAINYAISGTEVWSYHAVNLGIHLLAGLTLLGIVRRTLARAHVPLPAAGGFQSARHPVFPVAEQSAGREMTATLVGLSVALLWTVHPLQTESVTYIVQRAESLMGLFYLLTLYGFIRYVESPSAGSRARWALGSTLTCLCGMATKEVMVSAPVIVLLYDRTFIAGSFREAWRQRRRFYVALAATWILLGLCVMRGGGTRGGAIGFGVGNGWWAYGLTQFEAVGRYLLLAIWPHPLVFEYGPFQVEHVQEVLPWAVLVLPWLVGTVWALWRQPVVGFLGVWFLAPLAPTSLVPGTSQMIVEHRMYLSLAAVLVLAVGLLCSPLMRRGCAGIGPGEITPVNEGRSLLTAETLLFRGRSTVVFMSLIFASAVCFGWLTFARNAVYRSGLSLWTDTVARRPANPMAHYMLAEECMAAGSLEEARSHFTEAIRLHAKFFLGHERLGELLVRMGQPAAAIVHFEEALRLKPDFADAHANLGNLLTEPSRAKEAREHLERAVALNPDYAEAHYYLANLCVRLADGEVALVHYEAALRLNPEMFGARFGIANLLAAIDRAPEAVAHYHAALRLKPDSPAAEYNLANTFAALQQHENAITHYRQALRLKPNYPAAEYNLANSLATMKRYEEAIVHYREALRLKPDDAAAEMNLGSALFEMGRLAEAEAHYGAALRLNPNSVETRALIERVRAIKRP